MNNSESFLNRSLITSAEDIADYFWLSSFITDPAAKPIHKEGSEQDDDYLSKDYAGKSRISDELKAPAVERLKQESAGASLHTDGSISTDSDIRITGRGAPFRVPSSTALPARFQFARALKPYMQRIDSRVEFSLDELKTAETSAEKGELIPEFQPARERWFDLVLVIDTSPTMLMWYQTAVELKRLAEQTGAFRNVYAYRMELTSSDKNSEQVLLRTGAMGKGRHARSKELVDTSGRRLVMIFSDCSSPAWYSGNVYDLIKSWLPFVPTVITQPMPISMWPSTVLSYCNYVYASSSSPGCRNTNLEIEFPEYWIEYEALQTIPIPAIPLSPESINQWAHMMTGRGRYQFPAYYLPTANNSITKHVQKDDKEPGERWEIFKSATKTARQLAGFLAAAPLQLPVMRLVQRVMLPNSRQSHLAEVLRSNLFKLQTFEVNTHPDHIRFEFQPGMREFLLKRLFKLDKLKILKEVSTYVETYQGQWSGFRSWLENPDQGYDLPDLSRSDSLGEIFAEISLAILRDIGGEYLYLASRLEEKAFSSASLEPISASVQDADLTDASFHHINNLSDTDGGVRSADTQALAEIDSPEFANYSNTLLGDTDEEVRNVTKHSLANFDFGRNEAISADPNFPTHDIRRDFDKNLYVEREAELAIAKEWLESTRRVLTITSPPANGKTWFLTHFQNILQDDEQQVFKMDARDFLTEAPLGMREIDTEAMKIWTVTFCAYLCDDCASAPSPNGNAEIAAVLDNLAGHISTECWPGQILYLFVDGCDEPSDTSWKIIEKQIIVPILAHHNWRLIIALRQSQRLHSLLLRQTEKPLVLLPLDLPQTEKEHPGHVQLQKLTKQGDRLTPPLDDILAMLPDYNWIHPGLNHFLFLEACYNYANHQKVAVQEGFLERGISALTPLSDTKQILIWLITISNMPDEWRIEELADILGQSRITTWQIMKMLQDHLLITNINNRYRITDGVREFIHAAQALESKPSKENRV